jgi:hypothetical protein
MVIKIKNKRNISAMSKIELIVGGVYKSDLSNRLIRLISFDDSDVFYDVWWEHLNGWGYRVSLRSKVFYTRSSLSSFLKNVSYIRSDIPSEAEIKVYRPELPHHLFLFEKLSWGSQPFANISDCKTWLQGQGIEPGKLPMIDAPQLALIPLDAKSNHKKTVLAHAINGYSFTGAELFFHAYNAQAPYMTWEDENGIGLHRLGFEKGMPSYYIGSYHDLAAQYINPALVKQRRIKIQSLAEVKKMYPFKEWRAKHKEGFEQFTAANCKKATQIADALVAGLMALKDGTASQKLDLFRVAVLAYNQLNDETGGTLLETEEREELVGLINTISGLVGLDPKDYGGGEGVATEWRDW